MRTSEPKKKYLKPKVEQIPLTDINAVLAGCRTNVTYGGCSASQADYQGTCA